VFEQQVIWLHSTATAFAAPCEACRSDPRPAERAPSDVEGSLKLVADVGFVTCRRGHRIRVRRIARAPLRVH
jgi:hypothetical protein